MWLLPNTLWRAQVRGGSVFLSAWGVGESGLYRHWVVFDPRNLVDDAACIADLRDADADIYNPATAWDLVAPGEAWPTQLPVPDLPPAAPNTVHSRAGRSGGSQKPIGSPTFTAGPRHIPKR